MANYAGRSKFTGGEWSIGEVCKVPDDYRVSIIGPEGWLGVADVYGDSAEEVLANAKLVSAAPKLFWELADILLALENGGLRKPKQWETSIRNLLDLIID